MTKVLYLTKTFQHILLHEVILSFSFLFFLPFQFSNFVFFLDPKTLYSFPSFPLIPTVISKLLNKILKMPEDDKTAVSTVVRDAFFDDPFFSDWWKDFDQPMQNTYQNTFERQISGKTTVLDRV